MPACAAATRPRTDKGLCPPPWRLLRLSRTLQNLAPVDHRDPGRLPERLWTRRRWSGGCQHARVTLAHGVALSPLPSPLPSSPVHSEHAGCGHGDGTPVSAVDAVHDAAEIARCARLPRVARAARHRHPAGGIDGVRGGWSHGGPPWTCVGGRRLGAVHPPCREPLWCVQAVERLA